MKTIDIDPELLGAHAIIAVERLINAARNDLRSGGDLIAVGQYVSGRRPVAEALNKISDAVAILNLLDLKDQPGPVETDRGCQA